MGVRNCRAMERTSAALVFEVPPSLPHL